MLKVSPLPSLPQLRAHQPQGRGSNTRTLFKTRKGAKLNPQKWSWVELTETELQVSAIALPPLPSPSSLTFEFKEFPTSKATNKLELQLLLASLNRNFKLWAQTLPVAVRRGIAGGISGAISKTATAPLEAIKLQVVQGHMNSLHAARMLYVTGGLGSFFKGKGVEGWSRLLSDRYQP